MPTTPRLPEIMAGQSEASLTEGTQPPPDALPAGSPARGLMEPPWLGMLVDDRAIISGTAWALPNVLKLRRVARSSGLGADTRDRLYGRPRPDELKSEWLLTLPFE